VTVWITKLALTEGIFTLENVSIDGSVCYRQAAKQSVYYRGREWHLSAEAATARAEEMRQAKIASHRKAIARLEKMRFGVSE